MEKECLRWILWLCVRLSLLSITRRKLCKVHIFHVCVCLSCVPTYLHVCVMFCLFVRVWACLRSGQADHRSLTTSRRDLAEFVSLSTKVIVRTTTHRPQREWQRADREDMALISLMIHPGEKKWKTSSAQDKLTWKPPKKKVRGCNHTQSKGN